MSRPRSNRRLVAAAIPLLGCLALLTGCGAATGYPSADGTASSQAVERSAAQLNRTCPERSSANTAFTVVNNLNVPFRMNTDVTDEDCAKYWSGISNPTAYNNLYTQPGSANGPLRLEITPQAAYGSSSPWTATFTLSGGEVLLTVPLLMHYPNSGVWTLDAFDGAEWGKSVPLNRIGDGRGTMTISGTTLTFDLAPQ